MPYNENGIGHAENKSSKMAAQFNASGKITLRAQVRNLFSQHKRLTVEQVSQLMNRAEISVQPRVSELKNSGFLRDSGQTKMGKWGTHITIWEVCQDMGEVSEEKLDRNAEIYLRRKSGEGPKSLAKEYDLSPNRIYKIVTQYEKRHIDD